MPRDTLFKLARQTNVGKDPGIREIGDFAVAIVAQNRELPLDFARLRIGALQRAACGRDDGSGSVEEQEVALTRRERLTAPRHSVGALMGAAELLPGLRLLQNLDRFEARADIFTWIYRATTMPSASA